MKRSPLKRRKRLNPVSRKTRTERWPRLRALRAHVLERARNICEYCGWRLMGEPLPDIHHIIKRSQGGEDIPSNAVALCRECHDRTDWPYAKGRLWVKHIQHETFLFQIRWAKPQ